MCAFVDIYWYIIPYLDKPDKMQLYNIIKRCNHVAPSSMRIPHKSMRLFQDKGRASECAVCGGFRKAILRISGMWICEECILTCIRMSTHKIVTLV